MRSRPTADICSPNLDGSSPTDSGRPAVVPEEHILTYTGEPAEPPRISPARGPPGWDAPPVEVLPDWDALAQLQPKYVFDQRVPW